MPYRRTPQGKLSARKARSTDVDPDRAVREVAEAVGGSSASAVLLFCSGDYDLERLAAAIQQGFAAPVVACTTSGQLGAGGFEVGGITGVGLHSPDLRMRPTLLSPLASCREQAATLAREHAQRVAADPTLKSFGVLLVDGLSRSEEFVAAALYEALGDVPVVGGSSGPSTTRQTGAVYYGGKFHDGAAVLALFDTHSLAVETFAVQHFRPSAKKLVITLADPDQRVVYEINGEPAARAYAAALGVPVDALGPSKFACHPLLLNMGEQLLPRAIRHSNPDDSLTLACAVEEGLVVSLGESPDPLGALESAFSALERRLPQRSALLVFDCVLRRIELEERGLAPAVSRFLAQKGAVGFSSWGEQIGPLHVTHTLTGIALGARGAHR